MKNNKLFIYVSIILIIVFGCIIIGCNKNDKTCNVCGGSGKNVIVYMGVRSESICTKCGGDGKM